MSWRNGQAYGQDLRDRVLATPCVVAAWQVRRNRVQAKVNWEYTARKARLNLAAVP